MVIRLQRLLAVLLMIGLSFQAAGSMAPVCETGGSMTHQSIVAADVSAAAAIADAASEATQECDRMLLNCPAAVLPGNLPQLAMSPLGQSFTGSSVRTVLFLTDGPTRPPRSA